MTAGPPSSTAPPGPFSITVSEERRSARSSQPARRPGSPASRRKPRAGSHPAAQVLERVRAEANLGELRRAAVSQRRLSRETDLDLIVGCQREMANEPPGGAVVRGVKRELGPDA